MVFAKCCEAVERDDTEFNVLTHGDLWVNNIMFKYDQTCGNGDAPVDIKFVRRFSKINIFNVVNSNIVLVIDSRLTFKMATMVHRF